MTVNEALVLTQKKKAGLINRVSVRYAETLLLPGEEVQCAAIANIFTRRDKFPGIVVITDKRVIAACGLAGIKRSISLPVSDLESCEETSSVIQYKATFRTHRDSFAMTVDPDVGKSFTTFIAKMNGESITSVKLDVDGNVRKPNLFSNKKLNQDRKEREKKRTADKEIELQKKAAERFESGQ